MSVTIVSALPQTSPAPQANGIESMAGSDAGSITFAFADILLGKQLTSLSGETSKTLVSEVSDDSGDSLAQADNGEVDPTSILAALGLAAPQPVVADATAKAVTREQIAGTGSAGQAGNAAISLTPAGAGTEKSRESEMTPQTALSTPATTAIGADSPAKFAVAAASVTEMPLKTESSAPSESQDKAIANLTSQPAATMQRDAPLTVQTHVRDQAWSSDFAQKVVWLVSNDKQSAQLTLNPPQMGPIEISLNVDKGNASATFVSANAEVRDAIETAMPRLREMFASAGIQLGQTNVSSESFRQQSEGNTGNPGRAPSRVDNAILASDSGNSLTTRAFGGKAANGLVDLFA